MNEKFKVVFTGRLGPGADFEAVVRDLTSGFRLTEEKARSLLQKGKPTVLKKDLPQERAVAFRDTLRRLGMEARVEPMPPVANQGLSLVPLKEEQQQKAPEESRAPTCPKCDSEHLDLENDTCLDCGIILSKYRRIMEESGIAADRPIPCPSEPHGSTSPPSSARASATRDNPYAAPQAEVDEPPGESAMTGPYARGIAAGWQWIKDGFQLVNQNAGGWIGAMVVMGLIGSGVSLIPYVGGLTFNLLSPVFMGGFMLGAEEQRQGGDFRVSHLFAGFSGSAGPLILLGLLFLLAIVAIGVVVGGLLTLAQMGGFEAMQALEQGAPPQGLSPNPSPASKVLTGLVMVALLIPVLMAYCVALALIAVEGLPLLSALKHSFLGCLKNILPFLWYGILAVVLILLGGVPMGLGLLVVIPILNASIYASYRGIYYR